MMTPLGSAGGLQERVREVVVEESKVRTVGGEVGTTTKMMVYSFLELKFTVL